MRYRSALLVLLAGMVAWQAPAAVTLPRLISDHMMLQQGVPVRIWGKASPGEAVTVRFRDQNLSTKAEADGRWEVYLAPMQPGAPADLRIEGDNSLSVRDVLVGEVWVASGQSNMVWPVQNSDNAEQEAAAAKFPQIRLFKVTLKTSDQPLDDVEGEWLPCTPDSVKSFSAVGYFFARRLHRELKTPVGVIQSAWGGTPAEAWTSIEALKAEPALDYFLKNWDEAMANYASERARQAPALKKWEEEAAAAKAAGRTPPRRPADPRGPGHPHAPATLYKAMIAPLVPHAIRGAIWYQGESNANRPQVHLYGRLFQTMILDWRARWGQGQFPFLFVQLANYAKTGENSAWPELREAQATALQLRNSGMAVTTDVGDPGDIHPRNKQDVGARLAGWALAEVYGKKLVYSGPLYRQMTRQGGSIRLWFDHVGGGLKAAGGGLQGFTIAGADRVFRPAEAKIESDTVVVSSPGIPAPEAVRYGWADDPVNTLRNAEGLPASPFRTDRWRNARMPQ